MKATFLVFIPFLSACASTPAAAPTPPMAPAVRVAAVEQDAYARARPVFVTYCAGCHTRTGAKATPKSLAHLDMTTYPFGGHHGAMAGPAVAEVLGLDGSKATMPFDKPGAVPPEELARVKAWVEAYDAAHPKANAAHDDDDVVR
jgi:mono/diheme cytochrome c family protein